MSNALSIHISDGVTLQFATAGDARGYAQHLEILLPGLLETLVTAAEYVDAGDLVSGLMIARDMANEIKQAGECADQARRIEANAMGRA